MMDTVQKELAEAREVCPTSTRRMLAEGALLVDVREAGEVAQASFADCEVMQIPLSEFETRWSEVPQDRDVILACAGGQRSLKATNFLMYQGYTRVTNMQSGMQRWAARGFPVTGKVATSDASREVSSCCGSDTAPASEVASCCGGETAKSGAGCGCESPPSAKDCACC